MQDGAAGGSDPTGSGISTPKPYRSPPTKKMYNQGMSGNLPRNHVGRVKLLSGPEANREHLSNAQSPVRKVRHE
jgi:hypothetical protein